MAVSTDLALKYRSKSTKEYVGNQEVKRAMAAICKSEQKPHVTLLFGDTGCGKTTGARMIAMNYMCDTPLSDGSACGECANCIEMMHFIETGEEVLDVHEIDLTSKVNSNRDAMENMLTEAEQPTFYKYKIYIMDECQMAPETAQQRMLKILEEPPEHLVFIFCTTDPQKLLPTLLNRCRYRLHVTKPTSKELCERLQEVCRAEGIEYTSTGLKALAKVSKNTPRQALNNLERLVNEKGDVTEEGVAEIFGVIQSKYYFDFLRAILKKNEATFIRLFVELIGNSRDLDLFIDELLEFISLGIYVCYNARIDEISTEDLKVYKDLFDQFGLKDLLYISEILLEAKAVRLKVSDDYTLSTYLLNKLIYKKEEKTVVASEETAEAQYDEVPIATAVEKVQELYRKTKNFMEVENKINNREPEPLGFDEIEALIDGK